MTAHLSRPACYRIQVQGAVDPQWSEWFGGLTLAAEHGQDGPVTVLAGPVPDQAALRGILNALWDLNLMLISVTRLDA